MSTTVGHDETGLGTLGLVTRIARGADRRDDDAVATASA
jgi:hypothetical protein